MTILVEVAALVKEQNQLIWAIGPIILSLVSFFPLTIPTSR